MEEGPGDILVFLTGQEEIESVERLVQERLRQLPEGSQKLLTVPIFSSLPSEQQMKAFMPAPAGFRKVVWSCRWSIFHKVYELEIFRNYSWLNLCLIGCISFSSSKVRENLVVCFLDFAYQLVKMEALISHSNIPWWNRVFAQAVSYRRAQLTSKTAAETGLISYWNGKFTNMFCEITMDFWNFFLQSN